jgi:hypothetical protein
MTHKLVKFLFLVFCFDELFSQCKEIWGSLYGEFRGISIELCQENCVCCDGLDHVHLQHTVLYQSRESLKNDSDVLTDLWQ